MLMILSICGIQLRLLCNLLDGMVAIEGGFKTKTGEIFNELPDRLSDALILIGAAYSVPTVAATHDLGWPGIRCTAQFAAHLMPLPFHLVHDFLRAEVRSSEPLSYWQKTPLSLVSAEPISVGPSLLLRASQ
jgi:phosphatidylglycerophosphate synthase